MYVVTHDSTPIWRRISPKRKFKWKNADMCSDVAGPSSSASGICLSFQMVEYYVLLPFPPLSALLAAILDLSVTTTTILLFGRVTSSCIRSITCSRCEARENMGERVSIGFSFTSDWLRIIKQRDLLKSIAILSDTKPKQMRITFDTQLKIALIPLH